MSERIPALGVIGFALVLTIALTQSVPAQQYYQNGNCLYQPGSNQLVGCYSWGSGRLWYYHVPAQAIRDEKTGVWLADHNGVLMIHTTRGWQPMANHPVGRQLIAEIQAVNQRAIQQQRRVQVTPGVVATPRPGGGMNLTITNQLTPAEIAAMQGDQRAADILARSQGAGNAATLAPDRFSGCRSYAGCTSTNR